MNSSWTHCCSVYWIPHMVGRYILWRSSLCTQMCLSSKPWPNLHCKTTLAPMSSTAIAIDATSLVLQERILPSQATTSKLPYSGTIWRADPGASRSQGMLLSCWCMVHYTSPLVHKHPGMVLGPALRYRSAPYDAKQDTLVVRVVQDRFPKGQVQAQTGLCCLCFAKSCCKCALECPRGLNYHIFWG